MLRLIVPSLFAVACTAELEPAGTDAAPFEDEPFAAAVDADSGHPTDSLDDCTEACVDDKHAAYPHRGRGSARAT